MIAALVLALGLWVEPIAATRTGPVVEWDVHLGVRVVLVMQRGRRVER